jgi:hypothetical protein
MREPPHNAVHSVTDPVFPGVPILHAGPIKSISRHPTRKNVRAFIYCCKERGSGKIFGLG